MKRYARQHRYHGGLHALDKQEALRTWEQRRKEEVPAGFALERSGAADKSPGKVRAARLEPAGAKKKYCAAHPDAESPWVCVDCGAHFCTQCIRPMMTFFNPAHGGYEHASAVCPTCKGRCVNHRFEVEKQHRIRVKEGRQKRRKAFHNTVFALLSLPFAHGVIKYYDGINPIVDLEYMLFVFAVLNFGFLRELDLQYKSFFVRVLPGFIGMNVFLYLVTAVSGSRIAFVLFVTPVKYVLLSGWCSLLLMGVEQSTAFFAYVYKGSQEPKGLTVKERYILGFAVAVATVSVVQLIAALVMSVLS
jgi:hypothetical protein